MKKPADITHWLFWKGYETGFLSHPGSGRMPDIERELKPLKTSLKVLARLDLKPFKQRLFNWRRGSEWDVSRPVVDTLQNTGSSGYKLYLAM